MKTASLGHLYEPLAGGDPLRLFMLDNYDSFTYNLVQYLSELGATVEVARNDAVSPDEIVAAGFAGIVISPGPGVPGRAGISEELIRRASGHTPLLGVCLGHQALGEVFGARVVQAKRLMHGKTSEIHHDRTDLFTGIDSPFRATRYHSLILEGESLAEPLKVTAWTDRKEIMAVRHVEHPSWGVQFHPESILTDAGKQLLWNFMNACREEPAS